jgi:hypothetical protein
MSKVNEILKLTHTTGLGRGEAFIQYEDHSSAKIIRKASG